MVIGVCLKNCRSYKQPVQIDLYPQTTITGANGVGKTTIAHAITYAFYGVNYYGQTNIGFLRNEKANDIAVQVSFVDQDGEYHRLTRVRKGDDKTSITLDSYTIRQADIEHMLCEKALFLSMFNPLYMPSLPDNDARELILKYLPAVTHEQTVSAMSDGFRPHIEGLSLDNPDEQLKYSRAELKRINKTREQLTGEMNAYREQKQTAGDRLGDLQREKEALEQKFNALKSLQFESVDLDELEMSKTLLEGKIKDNRLEIQSLTNKRREWEKLAYQHTYDPALSEIETKVKVKKEEYKNVNSRYKKIIPGFTCPICRTVIAESQLPRVKEYYNQQLDEIKAIGRELVAQKKEVTELARKDKEAFEQSLCNELDDKLATLQHENDSAPGHPSLSDKLNTVCDKLRYGNLTEQQHADMNSYEADMRGIDERIKELERLSSADRLTELVNEQAEMEGEYTKALNVISALREYITVRAKLAVMPLKMPHVKVRLYEQLLSGAVENAFCFENEGRKFSYLSPSEKIRTGIEVAAAIRKLTGLDFPVFIDEAESVDDLSGADVGQIGTYHGVVMPQQTIICKCAEKMPLTVSDRTGKASPLPLAG